MGYFLDHPNDLVNQTDAISTHMRVLLNILPQASETNLHGAGESHRQPEKSYRHSEIAPELMSRYLRTPGSDFGITPKICFTLQRSIRE
jgi:hypothetical protein